MAADAGGEGDEEAQEEGGVEGVVSRGNMEGKRQAVGKEGVR